MSWIRFGLELLSTFLGAALGAVFGIPAGLVLDRKRRGRDTREGARQARSILSEALSTNATKLATLGDFLGRKGDIAQEVMELELDVETWETVRPLVGEHLSVDLAARLARHFSETRWVERAVALLVKAAVNPDLARVIEHPSLRHGLKQVDGDDTQRGLQQAHLGVLRMREDLHKRASCLAETASQLRQQLGDSL